MFRVNWLKYWFKEVVKIKKLFCAAVIAVSCLATTPVMAGGYNGLPDQYTLTDPDGSDILMYQKMSIGSDVLTRIPSGTAVKLLKGDPEGWMLIEYNGERGYVTDNGLVILCSGVAE